MVKPWIKRLFANTQTGCVIFMPNSCICCCIEHFWLQFWRNQETCFSWQMVLHPTLTIHNRKNETTKPLVKLKHCVVALHKKGTGSNINISEAHMGQLWKWLETLATIVDQVCLSTETISTVYYCVCDVAHNLIQQNNICQPICSE